MPPYGEFEFHVIAIGETAADKITNFFRRDYYEEIIEGTGVQQGWISFYFVKCATRADLDHFTVAIDQAFAAGRDLYALEGGFRYPPLAAVLLVPFAWCGPLLGSILWRGLMWLVLARGVRAVLDAGFPYRLHGAERGVFLLLLTLASWLA